MNYYLYLLSGSTGAGCDTAISTCANTHTLGAIAIAVLAIWILWDYKR